MSDLRDMYGNEIYLLGETGYGVSVEFAHENNRNPVWPQFNFFHCSDNFRQSLFSTAIWHGQIPEVHNVFEKRIYELMSTRPHG